MDVLCPQVNQAWVWENYQIKLAGSNLPGKCIDLPGADAKDGNYLWLWECTGGDGQKYALEAEPSASALSLALVLGVVFGFGLGPI